MRPPLRILVCTVSLLALACGGEAAEDLEDAAASNAADAADAADVAPEVEGDGTLEVHPGDAASSPDVPGPEPDAAADADPTPVAHCSGPGDPGLSEEAQSLCEVCVQLPLAGSVPLDPPPIDAPFERVPELEAALNHPDFRYGDFRMVTSVVVQDLDGDGIDDLILNGRVGGEGFSGSPASRAIFFTETGEAVPAVSLPASDPSLVALTAADLDGDGLRDLLSVSTAGLAILWNTPLGFQETEALVTWLDPPDGLDENVPLPELVYTFTVMDLEGDGDTDVLVALFGGPNQIFRNEGQRIFTDITQEVGLADTGSLTFFVAPFAWDPDGGLRGLFVANDGLNAANHAFRLEQDAAGGLAAVAVEPILPACDGVRMSMCDAVVGVSCGEDIFANMQAMAGQGSAGSMGGLELGTFSGAGVTRPMGVGCFHHQGLTPMCVMGQTDAPAPDYIVRHTGGETWGLLPGVLDLLKPRTTGGHVAVSWAVLPLDDGDGVEDLLITTGDNEEFHTAGSSPMSIMVLQNFLGETLDAKRGESRIAVYGGQKDGRFVEVAEIWGFDGLGHYATAAPVWIDVNGVPLYHVIAGGFGQAFEVYRLVHRRGNLLRVRLRGTTDNPDGIGARVITTDGERSWTRIVGWESTQIRSGNLHQATTVGVGGATTVDVVVRWPNGLEEAFDGLWADGQERLLVQGEGVAESRGL